MIRFRDSVLLARTKLRTRRIRLSVLLVTMSLLFAALVFIANVATGTIQSVRSFSKEGLGNAFYVQAHPTVYYQFANGDLINQLKPLQDQLIAQKKALAKKLGVNYDPKTDNDLYYVDQQIGPSATDTQSILTNSTLALNALNAQNAAIPGISFDAFSQKAKTAGATAVYRSTNWDMYGTRADTGSLKVLLDGKEDMGTDATQQSYGPPVGVASIQSLGWSQMSDGLLQPFMLPGQETAVGTDGSIPIIAPYSAAEEIAGLNKLPTTATSQQKLDRLVAVRQQVAGRVAELCYRNTASEALLQKVLQQRDEIAANKNNKDYVKPHVLYALPTEACGPVTVAADTRTAEEKKADANEEQFKAAFSQDAPATQGVIKLRIVGLTPDIDLTQTSISAGGILSTILASSVGTGWYSPASAFVPGTLAATAQNGTIEQQPVATQTYYAVFPTLAQQKAFITQADCHGSAGANYVGQFNPNNDAKTCGAKQKPFIIAPYGNNAGALEDLQHTAWKFLRFALLGVVLVAALVMMGTFGKVIADSRRETAVFRSLGATRFAISQVYFTYTLIVCLLVAVFAVIVGSAGAWWLSDHFKPGLSVTAVLAYNAHDVHKQFTLFGINALYILVITGLIVLSGLLSASIPLLLNMRRNPIKDLRDE